MFLRVHRLLIRTCVSLICIDGTPKEFPFNCLPLIFDECVLWLRGVCLGILQMFKVQLRYAHIGSVLLPYFCICIFSSPVQNITKMNYRIYTQCLNDLTIWIKKIILSEQQALRIKVFSHNKFNGHCIAETHYIIRNRCCINLVYQNHLKLICCFAWYRHLYRLTFLVSHK